jgi:tetratricopeptide (TPR) repeat protein
LALVANHVDRLNLSFREYGRQLAAAPLDVLARARKRFTSDTGHSGSIYDAVGITYRGLDDDARSLLKTAACFAGRGIRPLLLRRASSLASEAAFDEALADLTDRFLVEREEEGRLSVHELVREFVSAQMSDAEAREVVTRVADTLAELMQEADESGDWSTARAETPHAVVAAGICRARCAGEPLRALSMQLGEYGMQHGDPGGAAERFGEALETARRLYGERSLEAAAALRELSWAYAETGREQDARDAAERALGVARDLLDPRDAELAEYENSLGYALRVMGDLDRALPHYQRALAIAGQAGGRRNRRFARYLNNIGAVLEAQGDLEAALDHMREALRIDESRRGAASSTLAIRQNNIGRVLGKLGQWEEALERHERAVALHEAAYGRKHPDVAASLFFAGRACRMLGRRSDALRLLSEAQQTYALFGDPARTLGRMIDDERSALLTEDENAS